MISKYNQNHKVIYFLAVCGIIYVNESMFSNVHLSASVRLLLDLFIFMLVVLLVRPALRIKKRIFLVFCLLITLQLLSILLNGISFEYDIYAIGVIVLALLFTSQVPENEYIEYFQKIIVAVSLVSTALFVVNTANAAFINRIPSVFLSSGSYEGVRILLGTIVIKLNVLYSYNRNFGIFMEPGMFQIFINTGIFFELFIMRKISKKRLLIMLLALITCISSTDFIVSICILISYLLNTLSSNNIRIILRVLRTLLLFLIVLSIYMYVDGNAVYYIISEVRGKLLDMQSNSFEGTGAERTRSIVTALQCWLQNPIFGLGYNGVSNYILSINSEGFIMTFSPLNWFARFGIIYGLVCNYFYVLFFTRKAKSVPSKILIGIASIVMISTQSVNSNMIVWMVIMYSIMNWHKHYLPLGASKKGNADNL